MVVSMTGFGRGTVETEQLGVTVEIKSVNHRFCEFHIRMPNQLLKIEANLKKSLATHIKRGRVEVYVTLDGQAAINRGVKIDWELLDQYFRYITEVKDKYGLSGEVTLGELVNRPELIQIEEKNTENEFLESLVLKALSLAIDELVQMRIREGKALELDVKGNIERLQARSHKVRQFAPIVVEQFRDRLTKKMDEFVGGQLEETRILTEVAIFADKADINEELTRLESHIKQFLTILQLTEPIGRKLDFLVQEMNREINTIGSKANDSKIAMEVVEMKSLLEKVKEQVQNIE
ncbi:YicC/YloC family endoribonuclease [Mesobacillus maritimus]|uniref:YicC family protein n=1 Tax=Mesobacillus maritimus TaxID=1643336 RepID=A0ABS7K682_9BACI|nr:YicC/YloC family endoribonuclease [Mesobacillus maritimus]MBY0097636.1 YicC family protein [Mesobacillus maritimus]